MSTSNETMTEEKQVKNHTPSISRTRPKRVYDSQTIPLMDIKNNSALKRKPLKRRRLFSAARKSIRCKGFQVPQCAQFSAADDRLILSSVLRLGPKFRIISSYFPSKTVSTVKNRYYKYLRYRWVQVMGKDFDSLQKDMQLQSEPVKEDNLLESVTLCSEVGDILKKMIMNLKSLTQS